MPKPVEPDRLVTVLAGVAGVAIYYKSVMGLRACEVFSFDARGKVCKVAAHYDGP